jgi:hypothetical protein
VTANPIGKHRAFEQFLMIKAKRARGDELSVPPSAQRMLTGDRDLY